MTELQNQIIKSIQHHSVRKTAFLTSAYIKAASADKEAILAGIHIEKWFDQTCQFVTNIP